MSDHAFPPDQVAGVYRAIRERRDMRHFLPTPIPPEQLERFLAAAHCAPSVGLMQPWRFVRIVDRDLRGRIHTHVDAERARTAEALGQRADEFMRLKVEGILDCAEVLVVALMDEREPYIFGRRTMPRMDLASAACAIQNFWLAARAEGIGVGWVSLFEPEFLRELCGMPPGAEPIAVLCVGHVPEFYPAPMLEAEAWDRRKPLAEMVYQDAWGRSPAG
jgi:5,6-dimethylbenzimidazole synthase